MSVLFQHLVSSVKDKNFLTTSVFYQYIYIYIYIYTHIYIFKIQSIQKSLKQHFFTNSEAATVGVL